MKKHLTLERLEKLLVIGDKVTVAAVYIIAALMTTIFVYNFLIRK